MFYSYNKKRIYLINADTKNMPDICENSYVISYGFNKKATISVSSFDDEKLVVSLQRSIINIYGKTVEPQEYAVYVTKEINEEALLLGIAVAIVCGASPEIIKGLVF